MNWDANSAIGEIVGAASVVVTLIYLANQIRLARVSAEATSTYGSLSAYGRWRTALLQNSDIPKAIDKANTGEPLNGEETIQLSTLMDDLFLTSLVTSIGNERWNTLVDGPGADIEYVVGILISNPGLILEWERFRELAELLSPEYTKLVDLRLAELTTGDLNQDAT